MRYFGIDLEPIERDSLPTEAEARKKQGERDLFAEWGDPIVYWRDRRRRFRAAKPESFEDVESGGYCARTGMWFPGSRTVRVGGVVYGDKWYRPDPEE
jgi:hypothetical protein